jgi:spore coat polysaccharide biosynthesis protein SpsF (cytidylyltransferase family)
VTLDHVRRPPRVVAIVSARMASLRVPAKALVPLAGRPLIQVLIERVARVPELDSMALATSNRPENRPLVDIARALGVPPFQGDEDDVLRRFIDCARNMDADHIVYVSGDNPLTDLETMARLVERHLESGSDYTYVPGDARLMGILSEVVSRVALERAWSRGEARHRGDQVTLYIKEHPGEFKVGPVKLPEGLYRPNVRLSVQEPEDVKLMQILFERLAAPGKQVATREALELLDQEPELVEINAELRRKAAQSDPTDLDRKIAML